MNTIILKTHFAQQRTIKPFLMERETMWVLSEIAGWWDVQRKQSELTLDQFVERNPNQFGFIIATALHTSMELGAGMVDVLRLGDGIAQGGFKGVATDGLRLLAIAGPAGKLTQVIKSSANARIARAILNPPGGICSWVAATKALAQTGQKNKWQTICRCRGLGKGRWRAMG